VEQVNVRVALARIKSAGISQSSAKTSKKKLRAVKRLSIDEISMRKRAE